MKVWNISNYDYFFNEIIEVTEDELIKALNDKDKLYSISYEIPKKNGKRHIYSLNRECKLYDIQKKITKNFINNIMLTDCCYGFRKGYNYIDFLEPHISFFEKNYYLRLDIKNFFESISYDFLEEIISYYVEENEDINSEQRSKIIGYIINILTYGKKIVQGAVTSPCISNVVFRQIDIRIERYCRKFNVEYSRYADDLLFSSPNKIIHSKKFLSGINKIISSKGFTLNYSKIRRGVGEISLNGYVVGSSIRISRKKLEQVSRVLFFLENTRIDENKEYIIKLNEKLQNEMKNCDMNFGGKYNLINYLTGNRAFLISVCRYIEEERSQAKLKRIIKRLEKIILKLA